MPKKVFRTFTVTQKMTTSNKIYFNTNKINLNEVNEVIIKSIAFHGVSADKTTGGIYILKSNLEDTEISFSPHITHDSALNNYEFTLSQTLDLDIMVTNNIMNTLTFELFKYNTFNHKLEAFHFGDLSLTIQFIKHHK
jgi:hypothetical protein